MPSLYAPERRRSHKYRQPHSTPGSSIRFLESFCDDWDHWARCPLHHTATHHVIYRGTLPCDFLFIGEAPGECEDATGQPFVGPAGKLLDSILDATKRELRRRGYKWANSFTYAITNILACAPWDKSKGGRAGGKVRPPEATEAEACRPRLDVFNRIASPFGIILLGKTAQKFYAPTTSAPILHLVHPAYLLRTGRHMSHEYAKCILLLVHFITEHL